MEHRGRRRGSRDRTGAGRAVPARRPRHSTRTEWFTRKGAATSVMSSRARRASAESGTEHPEPGECRRPCIWSRSAAIPGVPLLGLGELLAVLLARSQRVGHPRHRRVGPLLASAARSCAGLLAGRHPRGDRRARSPGRPGRSSAGRPARRAGTAARRRRPRSRAGSGSRRRCRGPSSAGRRRSGGGSGRAASPCRCTSAIAAP